MSFDWPYYDGFITFKLSFNFKKIAEACYNQVTSFKMKREFLNVP